MPYDAEVVKGMKIDLLPCPFCGDSSYRFGTWHAKHVGGGQWVVICMCCGARGTPSDCIEDAECCWNNRLAKGDN